MAVVLDGRETNDKVMKEVASDVETLKANGVTPGLALVLTGDDKYSARYVSLKKKRAEGVGIYVELHHLEMATDEELVALIHKLNNDPKIHGIMVQLPLADGLSELKAVDAIAPEKDVDGLSPSTLGKVLMGEHCFPPAGVEAIMELFRRYGIDPNRKHWVIIGSSNFLSKPLAAYVMNLSSNVTQVDEGCPHIAMRIKDADVISTEIQKKHFVKADMVKDGVIIIDNGNTYEGKKVYGDVDPDVYEKASAYTPVPGGTGPMLIAMLLKATVKAASN